MTRFPSLVVLMLAALSAGSSGRAAEYLVLSDFRLIDGTGAPARAVQRLVARDGVIVAIDTAGTAGEPGAGDLEVRLRLDGAHVMPGLIDTHVHVGRFPEARAEAERLLRIALRGGVTGVRDLAGDARALADVERAIGRREFDGPSLVFSALFGGSGLYVAGPTSQMAPGRPPGGASWARAIDANTDLPLAIAEAKGSGAAGIKLYGNMSPALAARVVAEAKRQGLKTWAHATVFPASPGDLVEAGVDSLSHAPYLIWEAADAVPANFGARTAGAWRTIAPDHPKLLALYARMAERGVSLDATLYVYKNMPDFAPPANTGWAKDAFAWAAHATRLAHEAGVAVTAGTDWFEPTGNETLPHTHDELALLVEAAGLTPMQAIVAGTRNGAAAMGMAGRRGTIEVGKAADLLVLDADPLADIRNTARIRMTIKDGVIVRP